MMVAQKFASFLTSLRSIALSLLLIILFAWNFGSINTSAKDVLAMVPRIQQFEASGVKVVLHDEIKLREAQQSTQCRSSPALKLIAFSPS
jgi:hypothetical protein